MCEEPKLTVPTVTPADHVRATVLGTLSAIGGGAVQLVGGAAVGFLNSLWTSPIERRRDAFLNELCSAMETLRTANANILTTIQSSESFQSVLLQATWAAIRNHQGEKLAALRNAVLNAAVGTTIVEDWQLLFVRYVDELTPIHLVIMAFLAKNEMGIADFTSFQNLFLAFVANTKQQIDGSFFKLVCDDLNARSLIRISKEMEDVQGLFYVTKIIAPLPENRKPHLIVTSFGHAFVEFVLHKP